MLTNLLITTLLSEKNLAIRILLKMKGNLLLGLTVNILIPMNTVMTH